MGQAQSEEGGGGGDDPNDLEASGRAPSGGDKRTRKGEEAESSADKGDTHKNQRRIFNKNKSHDKKVRYKQNLLSAFGGRGGGAGGTRGAMRLDEEAAAAAAAAAAEQQHVRKLSNVSNRNVQLLSMKPRSELDNYADGLRARRRSSLINLILGAPSRGPRFSDDLCSLSSHMSELCNFGIDYFPDTGAQLAQRTASSSLAGSSMSLAAGGEKPASVSLHRPLAGVQSQVYQARQRDNATAATAAAATDDVGDSLAGARYHKRRSSLGSLAAFQQATGQTKAPVLSQVSEQQQEQAGDEQSKRQQAEGPAATFRRAPSLASIFLTSIDLRESSDDETRASPAQVARAGVHSCRRAPALKAQSRQSAADSSDSGGSRDSLRLGASPRAGRINYNARRMIHRSGSELSLHGGGGQQLAAAAAADDHHPDSARPGSCSAVASRASRIPRKIGAHLSGCAKSVAQRVGATRGGAINNANAKAGDHEEGRSGSQQGECDQSARLRETKWIIMLQVCLPFILAGFGNMAAGLALSRMAKWDAFQRVPLFFVLLPSFVGLKGNIEMTLASRLSTLANLNLLDSGHQRRHAFSSNLVLTLSQALGLSIFATAASMLCELSMGKLSAELAAHGTGQLVRLSALVVLPCALATSVSLVIASSLITWLSVALARRLQVNPDNLSTLIAALYGDVSCVLAYGLFAQLMYSFDAHGALLWPLTVLAASLAAWPALWYAAHASKETRELALSSMPPMLSAIVVSLGSGAVLSLVVGRFGRIALYQPVVNGFGANLIAVQASRVSTWLWCNALRRVSSSVRKVKAVRGAEVEGATAGGVVAPYGSLASFGAASAAASATASGSCSEKSPPGAAIAISWTQDTSATSETSSSGRATKKFKDKIKSASLAVAGLVKLLFWSFCNSSPNSVAARLLLVMLVPAHSLYFIVIWALSPAGYVTLTWPFYLAYIGLCLAQVFVLLLVCEPLMSLLMSRRLDPDVFGISLLMALADLIGTLCLTGAFMLLAGIQDPNAS